MTPRSLIISSILGCLIVHPAHGQIIPDQTTGTTVLDSCSASCQITGGKLAGENLFHSFQDFSVQSGSTAYFRDPGVTNIFSRVTGSNVSEIFGTLGVSGQANLFLLNPQGIIFGKGASLDLNGNFFAATADAIEFGNDNQFSTITDSLEEFPILTVNPDALFFHEDNPGGAIAVNSSNLNLKPGGSITLIGQESPEAAGVSLGSANVAIPQGDIFLTAIKNGGKIRLGDQGQPSFAQNTTLGNITIAENSILNVNGNGGGNISIQGDQVALTGQSQLLSYTLGDLDGDSINIRANTLNITDNSEVVAATIGSGGSPDINIDAKDTFNLIGTDINAFQSFLLNSISGGDRSNNFSSVVYTFSLASGQAGDITINTKDLSVANGAWILASTINDGPTGNMNINASENLTIDGSGIILGSALNSTGNVSQLNLTGQKLKMQNGGVVSSSTLGAGQGGNINLSFTDSIELRSSLPNGFAPTGIYSSTVQGSGAAGDLSINTQNLTLADGSQLSSSSGFIYSEGLIPFGGPGGDIFINVKDTVEIAGTSSNGLFFSGIINNTFSDASAGNIFIQTNDLNLEDQGTISASAIGSGNGGDIEIAANDSIKIVGSGFEATQELYFQVISGQPEAPSRIRGLLTYTSEGKAGDIKITAPQLALESGAVISTSAFSQGRGGDLDLNIGDLDISGSTITSSALGLAESGDIRIDVERLDSNGVIASASAGIGDSGDISIKARDSIRLVGNQPNSLLPGGVFTSSSGFSYPGNLTISAEKLAILDGNTINASSSSNSLDADLQEAILQSMELGESALDFNQANQLSIKANSIEVAGSSPIGEPSSILTETTSPFAASNIYIHTSQLSIANQGTISVSSNGLGQAGNLDITADAIQINERAIMSGSTSSGTGGNINLQVQDLISVRNSSKIDTNAGGIGNGGNIGINTTFMITGEGSSISANALSGQGGNIDIVATDIFKTIGTAITASSELGIDGEVNLTTFNTSDRNSIVKLPETTLSTDNKVIKSCGDQQQANSKFAYTGKGGFTSSPFAEYNLNAYNSLADLGTDFAPIMPKNPEESKVSVTQDSLSLQTIIEMTTWKINQQGTIELVSSDKHNFLATDFNKERCPLH